MSEKTDIDVELESTDESPISEGADAPADAGAPQEDGVAGPAPDEADEEAGPFEDAFQDDEPEPEPELDTLQSELDALSDRHLRLAAEFTNFRRRAESERLEVWGKAQADLVGRLLDTLDDLQRVSGLDPAQPAVTVQSIVEGVDLVERKFMRALQDAGAEVVDPEEGTPFDPETMEAMMRVPVDEDELDDLVAQTFHRGYLFQGQLVRPARVSVYKAD